MKKTTKAWAIDTGDARGLIDVYCFPDSRPSFVGGNTIAVWDTRKDAKHSLQHFKGARADGKFPHAKVVRVLVEIEVIAATSSESEA